MYAHGETVGVRTYVPGAVDAHNNPADAWGAPVEWPGCAVAPAGSSEDSTNRTTVITTLDVYGPHDMEVGPRDLVVYDGEEFQVVGEIARWRNPYTGYEPGCVFSIRRVDG